VAPVERSELAPGFTISRVVTGLWQVADLERGGRTLDREAAARAMRPYVEAGLTTFDLADHYGSAEEIAGRFRSGHGDAGPVEILTKWVPRPGPVSRDDVRAAVQRALERLRADRIDLLQFHAWSYADPRWLDCLFWLDELKTEGLVRCLGLTNVDTAHLAIAVESGIDVRSNQVCYSLIDRRPGGPMTRFCLDRGIALLAYGTLAGGFLTERWLGRPDPGLDGLETWSQMKYRRFIDEAGGWTAVQGVLRVLGSVARRYGVSMANVACRWVLDQPAVGGIIVGARLGQTEHVADTRRLFGFALDPAARSELDAAAAALRPIPGDSGDEYRRPPFLTASGDLSHHVESFPPPYPPSSLPDGRIAVSSGTPWEARAGYARAVRKGNRVWVSGTTAAHRDRLIGGTDPAAQTHFVIDKITGALQSLGARLEDVVRTRIYVQRVEDVEPIARVHGERFRDILPANTLVRADLVGDRYLVEIEAEAVVAGGR
jgi:aryl-alcohol dehydrogenase-like predicted oxidoreductase/enamine deaminase RidA (YjgF/YER057c/UK114 family)